MALLLSFSPRAQAETTRDPWLWPFATESIWNTPIGSEAVLVPAGLAAAPRAGWDEEWLIRVSAQAPKQKLLAPKSWSARAGGTKVVGEVRIDDNLVVPDARKGYTPNACAAFLLPDGHTVRHVGVLCRPEAAGAVFGYPFNPDSDLFGDGLRGSHGGSGLSALGGSIRLGELPGDAPIRHALKVDLFAARYAYYGEERKGFRWPATRADGYARDKYRGTNPAVVMGSLLALPADIRAESLNLQTPVGRKLFRTLQDYGAYVVDDAAWDCTYLCAEKGVAEEMEQAYGLKFGSSPALLADVNALIAGLAVVDNNAPDRPGGGGRPRVAPAPPLGPAPVAPTATPAPAPSAPGPAATPAKAKVEPPPKAPNAWTAAEGFYPDYPNAWRTFHEQKLARARKGGINVLFLGDSLTQHWEKQPLWKERYEPLGAANFGIGGDGTPQVLWRIEDGELDGLAPKVVVLMIGINNTWPNFSAADTVRGIETIVQAIRTRLPQTKILLLGVLPIWEKNDPIRTKIREINVGLASLDDGENLRFLDFGEKLLNPDGSRIAALYQNDRLHLTAPAYRIYADAIDPLLKAMLP